MTVKGWVTLATVVGGLSALLAVGWEIDRSRRMEIRDGGAAQEKFEECCARVQALDDRITTDQIRQDVRANDIGERTKSLEAQAEWWRRRAEAQDLQVQEIMTRLGRIEGKLDGRIGTSGR